MIENASPTIEEKEMPEKILWIKKLLKDGYEFFERNQKENSGYTTILRNGAKTKIISHSRPILDGELK